MSVVQTVCPSCAAINRVPEARLSEAPVCGKCHQPLFQASPRAVDDVGFQRLLQKEQLPLVVDFWAEWCGPCKAFAPVFAEVAAQMDPRARFIKVDTERAQQTAAQFGIRSIPTLMVFKQGQRVAEQSGAMPPTAFRQWLEANLVTAG